MAFLQSRKGIDITIVIIIIVAILIAMAVIAAALRGIIAIPIGPASCQSCLVINCCSGSAAGTVLTAACATFPTNCVTACNSAGVTSTSTIHADWKCPG